MITRDYYFPLSAISIAKINPHFTSSTIFAIIWMKVDSTKAALKFLKCIHYHSRSHLKKCIYRNSVNNKAKSQQKLIEWFTISPLCAHKELIWHLSRRKYRFIRSTLPSGATTDASKAIYLSRYLPFLHCYPSSYAGFLIVSYSNYHFHLALINQLALRTTEKSHSEWNVNANEQS